MDITYEVVGVHPEDGAVTVEYRAPDQQDFRQRVAVDTFAESDVEAAIDQASERAILFWGEIAGAVAEFDTDALESTIGQLSGTLLSRPDPIPESRLTRRARQRAEQAARDEAAAERIRGSAEDVVDV